MEPIELVKQIIIAIVEAIIWISLVLGTLTLVLKALGFLPKKLKDKLEKNEASDIKELFHKLNITPLFYIESMKSLALAHLANNTNLDDKQVKKKIKEIIKERTFFKSFAWGDDTTSVQLKEYIDLQGLTFVPEINKVFASYIQRLVSNRIEKSIGTNKPFTFDCIAVHENAAPFLGYEVSAKLRIPLIYVKDEQWDKFPEIILHGQEVSENRKSFMNKGTKLEKAIFVADFLMLGPHIEEVRSYLNRFGVSLEGVFLLAHKDVDGCRDKLIADGFSLNYWVSIDG